MRLRSGQAFERNRNLRLALCLVVFCGIAAAQTEAPPTAVEQERILALMRQYLVSYRPPDVAYDQMLTVFHSGIGSDKWHKEWSDRTNWIVNGGREYLRVAGRSGKPFPGAKWKAHWFITDDVPKALADGRATLTWDRWDTLRAHRLAVFDYTVRQQDSRQVFLEFAVDPGSDRVPHSGPVYVEPATGKTFYLTPAGWAMVPYSGSVYVEPATGAVWQTSEVISEIPARFKIRYSSDVKEYDQIALGSFQYMLRVAMTWVNRGQQGATRDEFAWGNFEKFDTASSINFLGVDSTPAPEKK